MIKTLIIGDKLGQKLAQKLNLEYVALENKIFPDGEIKPKLATEISAQTIILLLEKQTNENINDYLIRFLFVSRKLKELSQKVIGIMPYYPYARQDAVFLEGEPISSLYLAELLEKNLAAFVTCNLHEHRKTIQELFHIPAYNLSLFSALSKFFQDFEVKNTVVIGPDREAKTFVDDFCLNFPAEKIIFLKQRDAQTGKTTFSYPQLNLQGKDVIIVDDLVASGGTISEVAQIVQKFQAQTISFAFIHALFGKKSIEMLESFNPLKIITTNTIANDYYKLDIVEPLAAFLQDKNLLS